MTTMYPIEPSIEFEAGIGQTIAFTGMAADAITASVKLDETTNADTTVSLQTREIARLSDREMANVTGIEDAKAEGWLAVEKRGGVNILTATGWF
jgi:hypothetical protein